MQILISNPKEWADLWAAMDAHPAVWVPTTENMYDEMLGAVPPAAMGSGAFLVGEPNNHNSDGEAVYACFICYQGDYYAKHMTLRQFEGAAQK